MKPLILDIETTPDDKPWIKEDIAENLTPPGSMKKQDTIDKWYAEKGPQVAADKYAKCGLSADTGKIICIGYKVGDDKARIYDHKHGDEAAIIKQFFALLDAIYKDDHQPPLLIGHNLAGFDLPFIWRRSIINGIRPHKFIKPPAELKPWDSGIYDTMLEWSGIRDRISLDKLCKVFGIEGKDGMTGADVWPMYQEGKLDEISDYCRQDCELTYQIYKRMTLA